MAQVLWSNFIYFIDISSSSMASYQIEFNFIQICQNEQ